MNSELQCIGALAYRGLEKLFSSQSEDTELIFTLIISIAMLWHYVFVDTLLITLATAEMAQ